MKKAIINAASAASERVNPSVLSAHVNINGSNPVLTFSVITLIVVGAYTITKLVDSATSKKGGEV